jgi:hypothetical protein
MALGFTEHTSRLTYAAAFYTVDVVPHTHTKRLHSLTLTSDKCSHDPQPAEPSKTKPAFQQLSSQ